MTLVPYTQNQVLILLIISKLLIRPKNVESFDDYNLKVNEKQVSIHLQRKAKRLVIQIKERNREGEG
jgi:hypothetical protein